MDQTRSLTQEKVESMGWVPLVKGYKHMQELCESIGLDVAVYYRWVKESVKWLLPFNNVICSPKTDEKFLSWIEGEKKAAHNLVGIQFSKMTQYLKDASIPLDEALSHPISGVSPLVQFTFGGYLGYPAAVQYLKEEATDELLCKPWIADQLTGFKEYFP